MTKLAVTRRRTPLLIAALGVGTLCLLTALASGRPEAAVLGAPLVTLAVIGLAYGATPRVDLAIEPASDRVLQSGELVVMIRMRAVAAGPVTVRLTLPPDIELLEPRPDASWSVMGDGVERQLSVRMRPRRYGVLDVGHVVVAVEDLAGVVAWEAHTEDPVLVRVLPDAGTLRRLVRPARTGAFAGSQVSRARGDGTEFADLRPFQPGDRARSVNWRATARRDEPWVNERHAERNADVVLLLDTFPESELDGAPWLARAVPAAASLAEAYVRGRDRIGLVGLGGVPTWVLPGTGRRAHWAIVDELLRARARWAEADRSIATLPRRTVPPGAMVLALTPLLDDRLVAALADLRRKGTDVGVVELAPARIVAPSDELGPVAVRLWELERERRRRTVEGLGVVVATWPPGAPLAGVLSELDDRRRRAPARVGYR